jgi:hypothetical protein
VKPLKEHATRGLIGNRRKGEFAVPGQGKIEADFRWQKRLFEDRFELSRDREKQRGNEQKSNCHQQSSISVKTAHHTPPNNVLVGAEYTTPGAAVTSNPCRWRESAPPGPAAAP